MKKTVDKISPGRHYQDGLRTRELVERSAARLRVSDQFAINSDSTVSIDIEQTIDGHTVTPAKATGTDLEHAQGIAERIVSSVNNHDDLLYVLQSIVSDIEEYNDNTDPSAPFSPTLGLLGRAKDTITKATS